MEPEKAQPRLTGTMLALLSLLAMTSPLATDMYLPSFTEIATDLHTSAPNVQLTLTTFLLGIGIGQLFFGPLSDRYGNRSSCRPSPFLFSCPPASCSCPTLRG